MADKKRKADLVRHREHANQLRHLACGNVGFDIQVISKVTKSR